MLPRHGASSAIAASATAAGPTGCGPTAMTHHAQGCALVRRAKHVSALPGRRLLPGRHRPFAPDGLKVAPGDTQPYMPRARDIREVIRGHGRLRVAKTGINREGGASLGGNGLARDEGWRQRASGGHRDVADWEHLPNVVELCHTGGADLSALVRCSLHRSWSLQLNSLSPIP
jgi:hypothetical protein